MPDFFTGEKACWIILTLSFSGPLMGLAGKRNWFFDFFSHFRPHQTFLLLIATAWLSLSGHFGMAAVTLAAFLWSTFSLSNYFSRSRLKILPFQTDFDFSVLLANVYAKNEQHEKVVRLIRVQSPDIVVLIEINERWEKELKEALGDYSEYRISSREDFFGIAVFSRVPLKLIEEEILNSSDIPSLRCVIDRGEQEIVLWATHPNSPRRLKNWKLRNEQLVNLSRKVLGDLRPTLVVGDLNTAPWSPWFKVLKASRLRDSREGYGIRGTWPAGLPSFMRIPLDHILVSPEIRVLEHRVLKKIGSDHLPIFARFGIMKV